LFLGPVARLERAVKSCERRESEVKAVVEGEVKRAVEAPAWAREM
jgi:hypothetical protein